MGLMNKQDSDIRNLQIQIDACQHQLGEYAAANRSLSEKEARLNAIHKDMQQAQQDSAILQDMLRKLQDKYRQTEEDLARKNA